mmetsp:Transcript_16831/g.36542  ORF Transcript_16831/g.36542 Transcript_16831/m.36542 type:complete len:191 (-) Transcript_16831:994-1566(-)
MPEPITIASASNFSLTLLLSTAIRIRDSNAHFDRLPTATKFVLSFHSSNPTAQKRRFRTTPHADAAAVGANAHALISKSQLSYNTSNTSNDSHVLHSLPRSRCRDQEILIQVKIDTCRLEHESFYQIVFKKVDLWRQLSNGNGQLSCCDVGWSAKAKAAARAQSDSCKRVRTRGTNTYAMTPKVENSATF